MTLVWLLDTRKTHIHTGFIAISGLRPAPGDTVPKLRMPVCPSVRLVVTVWQRQTDVDVLLVQALVQACSARKASCLTSTNDCRAFS